MWWGEQDVLGGEKIRPKKTVRKKIVFIVPIVHHRKSPRPLLS